MDIPETEQFKKTYSFIFSMMLFCQLILLAIMQNNKLLPHKKTHSCLKEWL